MKKILYLILTISLISCKEKKVINHNLASDKEIYSVINYIIKNELNDKGSKNIYLSEEFPLELPNNKYFGIEGLRKIFSKTDIEFMKLQIDKRYHFRINGNLIKSRSVISFDSLNQLYRENEKSDKFWERFEKKYKAQEFDAVSLPIFSVDFKTVIISYGNHCGSLCGNGETAIYRKINGNWERIKTINFWNS